MPEVGSEGLGNPYMELADQLDKMQAEKNKGIGVSCVREIVAYLRMGHIQSARAVAFTDGDKIENYPDIKQLLAEHGMVEEFRLRDEK